MQPFFENPALKLYAIVASLLSLQMILLALWTGTVRVQRQVWVNPEDARLNKGEEAASDHPDVLRVKRAHQNLLENSVPFLIVGLLYALSRPTMLGAQAYFFTFLGARLLHSVFYMLGRQPFRTMMFVVGILAVAGMAIHVIRVAV